MKKILLLLCFTVLSFTSFSSVNASIEDIFWWSDTEIKYCDDGECWLENWIKITTWIDDIEKERPASEYIQDMVNYILTFLWIVAVIFIIYAWFNLLTSQWDDDKVSSSKKTIIYASLGLILIFLSYPIFTFIVDILNVGE